MATNNSASGGIPNDLARFVPPSMLSEVSQENAPETRASRRKIPVFDTPPGPDFLPDRVDDTDLVESAAEAANSVNSTEINALEPIAEPHGTTRQYSWQKNGSDTDSHNNGADGIVRASNLRAAATATATIPSNEYPTRRGNGNGRSSADGAAGMTSANGSHDPQTSRFRRLKSSLPVRIMRSSVAFVCAVVVVLSVGAAAVVSALWSTYVDPVGYAEVAETAFKDVEVREATRDALIAAVWEQYPPEDFAAAMGLNLQTVDDLDELPAEFAELAWTFSSVAEIQSAIDLWLPTYVDQRLADPAAADSWAAANMRAHTSLLESFNPSTSSGTLPGSARRAAVDLGEFRDVWRAESTGIPMLDYMIDELDLNVSFAHPQTVRDLESAYDAGSVLRVGLIVLAGVVFVCGLVIARRRGLFLMITGIGLVALLLAQAPVNVAVGEAMANIGGVDAGGTASLGGLVLVHGVPVFSQALAQPIALLVAVGIGMIVIGAVLFFGFELRKARAVAKTSAALKNQAQTKNQSPTKSQTDDNSQAVSKRSAGSSPADSSSAGSNAAASSAAGSSAADASFEGASTEPTRRSVSAGSRRSK